MTVSELGLRVRDARHAAGLSQARLALASGVSRPTIARLESGRLVEIGYRPLLRILHAVGLDLRLTTLNRAKPTLEDLVAEDGR